MVVNGVVDGFAVCTAEVSVGTAVDVIGIDVTKGSDVGNSVAEGAELIAEFSVVKVSVIGTVVVTGTVVSVIIDDSVCGKEVVCGGSVLAFSDVMHVVVTGTYFAAMLFPFHTGVP